ncbi:hypothetical protein LV779_25995 [Streptomyces thinghirensis]|nr:hypothetical protein [Streptomyces thinghirensis]
MDPVELRIRNEPETEPDSGEPFSSRHLVECLREGARRFGWEGRDPRPCSALPDRCSSAAGWPRPPYPVLVSPCAASARAPARRRFRGARQRDRHRDGARTVCAGSRPTPRCPAGPGPYRSRRQRHRFRADGRRLLEAPPHGVGPCTRRACS